LPQLRPALGQQLGQQLAQAQAQALLLALAQQLVGPQLKLAESGQVGLMALLPELVVWWVEYKFQSYNPKLHKHL
jgi:hypothetical protein